MDNIKDLKPFPTLSWFRHSFSPTAVSINLTDEKYVKLIDPHQPGEKLSLKPAKVNDVNKVVPGKVTLKIMGRNSKTVSKKNIPVTFSAFDRSTFSDRTGLTGT